MKKITAAFVYILFVACNRQATVEYNLQPPQKQSMPARIAAIAVPEGYHRDKLPENSFGTWLRNLPLTKDNVVYLYTGKPKADQSAHVAIIDIPVGDKDLQQCADAVMRLRAEYLLKSGKKTSIVFRDNNRHSYAYKGNGDNNSWQQYLETVFSMCGSYSLQQQLQKELPEQVQPGDVLIKGGFPGHAMMVVDVVENQSGHKMVLLAQGFMPAQSIHIVKNPEDDHLSPWYDLNTAGPVITPGFIFSVADLHHW